MEGCFLSFTSSIFRCVLILTGSREPQSWLVTGVHVGGACAYRFVVHLVFTLLHSCAVMSY